VKYIRERMTIDKILRTTRYHRVPPVADCKAVAFIAQRYIDEHDARVKSERAYQQDAEAAIQECLDLHARTVRHGEDGST